MGYIAVVVLFPIPDKFGDHFSNVMDFGPCAQNAPLSSSSQYSFIMKEGTW